MGPPGGRPFGLGGILVFRTTWAIAGQQGGVKGSCGGLGSKVGSSVKLPLGLVEQTLRSVWSKKVRDELRRPYSILNSHLGA